MFCLVFNEKDKEKMLSDGATFICKQGGAFLFNIKNINFENNDIEYVKVNDINF